MPMMLSIRVCCAVTALVTAVILVPRWSIACTVNSNRFCMSSAVNGIVFGVGTLVPESGVCVCDCAGV